MSFKAMKDICKELGYFGKKGRVVKNAKALEFYWVIPEGSVHTNFKHVSNTIRKIQTL